MTGRPIAGERIPERLPSELSVERFDPDAESGSLVASEHRLRYAWAAHVAADRAVLDAGCGTGYGTRILADAGAERAVGVDIAPEALPEESSSHTRFVVGDVRDLPFADGEFDLVVCFEVIEHVEERDEVLDELKRVLRPEGLLLASSPNPEAYPAGNPHHVYELRPEELQSELGSRFANTCLYRQDAWLASSISELAAKAGDEQVVPVETPRAPPYSLVAASDGALPALRALCLLGAPFEVRWWHDQMAQARHEVEERHAERSRAQAEAREARRMLLELEEQRALDLEKIRDAEEDVAEARLEAEGLRRAVDEAHQAVNDAHLVIRGMQQTRAWRLASSYWRLRNAFLGRRT